MKFPHNPLFVFNFLYTVDRYWRGGKTKSCFMFMDILYLESARGLYRCHVRKLRNSHCCL